MPSISFRRAYVYANTPEVPIVISVGAEEVRLNAKVDTGADYCYFQRDYAEQLGINVESGHRIEVSTAAGTHFIAYGHQVRLSCLDWRIDIIAYFAEDHGFRRNVVGRNGWLQHFRLALIDEDTTLYLSHYDDAWDS